MLLTALMIGALFAVVGYIVQFLRQHFSYWSRLGIASEPPHWLMGNFQGATITTSVLESCQTFYDKFKNTGPFVGFYWFTKKSAFAVDPDLIKQVLIKDFSKFSDRGMFHNPEDDPLTGTLFNLDGTKWRNMRNKLSPTFTSGKMKVMFPLVNKIGLEFVKVFEQSIENDEEVMEVRDLMARFTSDVIGTCAFGIETSSLRDTKSEFRAMGRKALIELRYGILGVAFRLNFPQLARRLHMKETLEDVEKYYLNIVKEAVEYREQNNVRRNDFMDMLIDLKNNKLMQSEAGEELKNLSFGEISAQAFVFLLAGFETSSAAMGFILYELAQHEEVQQRAREEVIEVLERHNQEFSYECMKEMVYMEQIINETLRMYTVVPLIHRIALEDYAVPGNPKYVIKKGMPVIIPCAAIHRDERYYPQPNDFNPDNFTPEKIAARDSVLHLPFGDGPRNCIGMRFGKMQIVVGLALLLKTFRFSVCEQTPCPMRYDNKSFFVNPEKGIPLKVTKL